MKRLYITPEGRQLLLTQESPYALSKNILYQINGFPGTYTRSDLQKPVEEAYKYSDSLQGDLYILALDSLIEEGLVEER